MAILWVVAAIAIGVLLALSAFWQGVLQETIGGIVGGLVVASVLGFIAIWKQLNTFTLQFLDPDELLTAENYSRSGLLALSVGENLVRISIKPRNGVTFERINFAFFDTRWLPWVIGRRRVTDEIKVRKVSNFSRENNVWQPQHNIAIGPEGTWANMLGIRCPRDNIERFDLTIDVAPSLKNWTGRLSLLMEYEHISPAQADKVRRTVFTGSKPMWAFFRKMQQSKPKALPN